MDPQAQLVALLLRLIYVACGALCASAMTIWRQSRQRRYLKKALENEQQATTSRVRAASKETSDRLLRIFMQEPRPTLQRLADDSETDFTIKR